MIADHTFFATPSGKVEDSSRYRRVFGFWKENLSVPQVHVISLAFDNLDIRFEKVFDIGKVTLRQRVAALVAALPQRIEQLNRLDSEWSSKSGGRFADTAVTVKNWSDINTPVNGDGTGPLKQIYLAAVAKLPTSDQSAMESGKTSDLSALLDRMTALLRAFDPTGNTEGYGKDLIANPSYGLNALRTFQTTVIDLTKALTAGPDPEEAPVAAVEAALAKNRKALDFYAGAAQILVNRDVVAQLGLLRTSASAVTTTDAAANAAAAADKTRKAQDADTAKAAFKKTAAAAKTTLDRELTNLQNIRPDGALNVMSGVTWPAIADHK